MLKGRVSKCKGHLLVSEARFREAGFPPLPWRSSRIVPNAEEGPWSVCSWSTERNQKRWGR